MTSLDQRGDIAAAEIAFYAIALCFCVLNNIRHGFSRKQGWLLITLFALMRFVGSILVVVIQQTSSDNVSLYIAEVTISSIALTPLISATLIFLIRAFRFYVPESSGSSLHDIAIRVLSLILLASIILSIVAGSQMSNYTDDSKVSSAIMLSHVAVCLLTGVYGVIVIVTGLLIFSPYSAPTTTTPTMLLHAIALSLPFLLVRIIYSLLSAFTLSVATGGYFGSGGSKFNNITGSWQIYLGMGVIMEFAIIIIYVVCGVLLEKFDSSQQRRPSNLESLDTAIELENKD
ncbi:uncharacterized protein V1518DRAFT_369819 [Limtongia smithiae]|uniref:uncharacterized protein n=1 Tax=Limtongia smithiae TaxID=1125753 RepID=UPI0034CE7C3C